MYKLRKKMRVGRNILQKYNERLMYSCAATIQFEYFNIYNGKIYGINKANFNEYQTRQRKKNITA